ncbi:MAG: AbgT family transporter [Planctomycetota bacterium]
MADAPDVATQTPDLARKRRIGGPLDLIEAIGNLLPDAATLFLLGALLVMLLSQIAVWQDWLVVVRTPVEVVNDAGETVRELRPTGEEAGPRSLLTSDGIYWALSSMVDNFMGFAPLGVVLTGMLGIGVAEKTGLISAALKAFMKIVPNQLLTPAMIFLGIMSSMGLDAGYVVLPPLAAALYKSVGRSPLAGIAAVFAGVAAGFNANLFVTGLDPMLAELSTTGAQVLDADYEVAATCNWYFMVASTFVITGVGWLTTALFVERRLARRPADEGGATEPAEDDAASQYMSSREKRGLGFAAACMVAIVGLVIVLTGWQGSPLFDYKIPGVPTADQPNPRAVLADVARVDGEPVPIPEATPPGAVPMGDRGYYLSDAHARFVDVERGLVLDKRQPPFPRWVSVITPLILIASIIPGLVYGVTVGTVKGSKDAGRVMIQAIEALAPIIVLAFFAAQFIEYLKYSGLDVMMAHAGGQALARADLSPYGLMIAFILMTMFFNMFIGSMSAKYTLFAPIFIPMFMYVGISPELTQATYRIGDSTTNIITPLNAYLVIILVFMQKVAPRSGMGTLIAMMMPYTIVFTIAWAILLLIWMALGIDLGPAGPQAYEIPAAAG